VIDDALAACRAARSPASYTAFRRLLITRPVLTATDLAAFAAEIDLVPVFEVIRRCYEPAPAAYIRDGQFQLCGRCGCLLVPLRDGGYRCELDRCRADGGTTRGTVLPAANLVLQLSRPLRVFITGPGLAETDLEKTLRKSRARPRDVAPVRCLRPACPFPDGTAWAVDVKDWASPSLLGAKTAELRASPPHNRAFIVVPPTGSRSARTTPAPSGTPSHRACATASPCAPTTASPGRPGASSAAQAPGNHGRRHPRCAVTAAGTRRSAGS